MSGRPSIILEKPVETARGLLGQCLGKLQDISSPGLNVKALIEKVAQTVRTLFDIGKYDPMEEPHKKGTKEALELIGQSLAALQDVGGSDPAVYESSQILARVLAILYPISKAQESMVLPAARPAAPAREVAPHPRRTMPRITLNVDIGVQSENNFYTGFSEDISEGGLFMTTYDFKPIGTKVNFSFTLPSGYLIMASGTVRWIREFNPMTPDMPPGMGIQFDELSPEDRAEIENYINTNAPMFYE
jgi:uncharacterized protein (TIGR02266 family)